MPPGDNSSRKRVLLTPDAIRWLDVEKNREILLDRKSKELVTFDHDQKLVRVRPFLGWIASLDQERHHRLAQAKALKAAGVEAPSFETFWLESLFRAGGDAAKEVKREGNAFRRGEDVVLTLTPGEIAIPDALRGSWRVFLVRTLKVHGAVRSELTALETLPTRIAYQYHNVGRRTDATLEFGAAKAADRVDLAEARKSYKRWLDPNDELDVLFDDIIRMRAERKVPTQADYAKLVTKRAKEGAHLDAFLLLIEGGFAYPAIPMRELAGSIDMQSDQVKPFLQILQTVQPDPEAAVAAIASIDREGLQGTATLDAMLASVLVRLKKTTAAEALYFGLLRQKPWLAGPWKDLGDLYTVRFKMEKAWLCWDRAATLAPKHPLLQGPIGLRKHLELRYSDWLKD